MLSIIVPYRDREEQLKQFIPHMNKYLPDAKILIVEQADDKPFNRGKLLNIGFIHASMYHRGTILYCFHDVDILPINVDYHKYDGVQQKILSKIQQVDYLGGCTVFDHEDFIGSGGYHNDFFHRAEDNEMMFNLKRLGLTVQYSQGKFLSLPHERKGPEFLPELWKKAQLPRTKNMLITCKYELVSKEVFDKHTHIRAKL